MVKGGAMGHPLVKLLATDPKRVIGLCAASAGEGIDAALCEISGSGAGLQLRLLRWLNRPLLPSLRQAVEALLDPGQPTSAAELSTVNFRLGQAFAEAAAQLEGDGPVDLVGSHGLTVWHQGPWMKQRADLIASTLQLGEPALVAARLGAVTVADFRVADVAVAGEGAPLSPRIDWLLYRQPGAVRALVDLAAVTNVAVVADGQGDSFAFDSGPGVGLLGALAQPSGGTSAVDAATTGPPGRVLPALLARLLDDDYLRRPPPKSTGSERYGRGLARQLLEREAGADPADLAATALAFVAEAVAHSLRTFVLPRAAVSEVLLSGAGADHPGLLEAIGRRLAPLPVRDLAVTGVASRARAAVAFAVLAVEAVHASPASLPAATGARRPAILGKICLPPPA